MSDKIKFLDYEIASSWWAAHVSLMLGEFGREMIAGYYARKVNRKYRLYQEMEAWKRQQRFKELI